MKIKSPVIEIFSQGEEIISGQTVDTNAAWLSTQLASLGFHIHRHTAVGDDMQALVSLLGEVSERADCCICTGGLGPTCDDLTAEAVSDAFDLPLRLDSEAVDQIEAHFTRFGQSMPEVNLKQAMLPDTSERLDNVWGTAPGFALRFKRCWFVFVPGVPYEMKNMFKEIIKPRLGSQFELEPPRLVTIRSVGIGESAIQARLDALKFPDDVSLSFRAGPLEIETKLIFGQNCTEFQIKEFVEKVSETIGHSVFGIDGMEHDSGNLVEVIGAHMIENHQTLSLVETLSGGKMAARCAGLSWFKESLVTDDRFRIYERLGLPGETLESSHDLKQVATTVSSVLAEKAATDYSIAQLWCEQSTADDKHNSTVDLYSALATPNGVFEYSSKISGRMARKQTVAANRGLDMLRRYLQGYLG